MLVSYSFEKEYVPNTWLKFREVKKMSNMDESNVTKNWDQEAKIFLSFLTWKGLNQTIVSASFSTLLLVSQLLNH